MKQKPNCSIAIQTSNKFNIMNVAIEDCIQKYITKLVHQFGPILDCKVYLDCDEHLYRGKKYHVSLKLHLPNIELAVNRNPIDKRSHEDIYVAIRDSFEAAKHQLQRRVDKLKAQRHRSNHHYEMEDYLLDESWMLQDVSTINQNTNSRI